VIAFRDETTLMVGTENGAIFELAIKASR